MDNIVDITGEAFARRLGNLLAHHRRESGLSLGAVARRSNGRFNRRQLRRFEAALGQLDAVTASALAALYGADIESILPVRTDIAIDPGGGTISAGGVHAAYEAGDPRSLLETYLRLVRRLRDQERHEAVDLRREDIEGLAAYLGATGESVVEQLGALMGATRTQRRAMAGMFLAGALIITVAVPSVAAVTGGESSPAFDVNPGSPWVTASDAVEVADQTQPPVVAVRADVDDRAARERPVEHGVVLEDVDQLHDVVPEPDPVGAAMVDAAMIGDPVVEPPVVGPPVPDPAPSIETHEVAVAPPPVPPEPSVVVEPTPDSPIEEGAPPAGGASPEHDEPAVAAGPPPVPDALDVIVEPGSGPVFPVAGPVSP
jgi:hypothetical protein